jgi:hypothetical protein
MQLRTKNASHRSKALVETILGKMSGLNKPRRIFITSIMILYLSMRGRYTFKGFERYGEYCEKSYRLQFEKTFDFLEFNKILIQQNLSRDLILAFDPSYLPKSGKKTPNIDRFWSGCLGKAVKGIEIGGLGVVDIEQNTAFNLEAIQTPNQIELKSKGQTLVDHYANIIVDRKNTLVSLSKYLVVDGYFSKVSFVDRVVDNTGLHIVSKLRKDANLKYLYNGVQKGGRGRPRKFSSKIDLNNLDKRVFKETHKDDDCIIYEAIVWSVSLKRKIKVAYVQFLKENIPSKQIAILFSTDLELSGYQIYRYYKARYQIEFLFRDGKQHLGLTHCQSRSENKLHFHFNTSLTAVGVAKVAHYLQQEGGRRKPRSLADIKTSYFNELVLNLFLSNFQIDPNLEKNNFVYQKLLNFGKIAA